MKVTKPINLEIPHLHDPDHPHIVQFTLTLDDTKVTIKADKDQQYATLNRSDDAIDHVSIHDKFHVNETHSISSIFRHFKNIFIRKGTPAALVKIEESKTYHEPWVQISFPASKENITIVANYFAKHICTSDSKVRFKTAVMSLEKELAKEEAAITAAEAAEMEELMNSLQALNTQGGGASADPAPVQRQEGTRNLVALADSAGEMSLDGLLGSIESASQENNLRELAKQYAQRRKHVRAPSLGAFHRMADHLRVDQPGEQKTNEEIIKEIQNRQADNMIRFTTRRQQAGRPHHRRVHSETVATDYTDFERTKAAKECNIL